MQVIKTDIIEKYQTLPMMIAEETGEDIEYVLEPTSDRVWHYYFLDGNSSIKPDTDVAVQWDSKIYQYDQLGDIYQIPDYIVYDNIVRLMPDLQKLLNLYGSFMITTDRGFNGKNYMYVDESTHEADILMKFVHNGRLRVSEYIPNVTSVSLHLIVANRDEFYVSPIVKQHIDGTLYRGGSYPYYIDIDCSALNRKLFDSGYVGLAHVDFMIADDIWFGEINPRIAGSTPYMSYSLEREYGINLPYLEYYAVQNQSLPDINTERICNITWDFIIQEGKPKGNWINHLDIRKAFDTTGTYYIPFFEENKHIKLEISNDQGNNI